MQQSTGDALAWASDRLPSRYSAIKGVAKKSVSAGAKRVLTITVLAFGSWGLFFSSHDQCEHLKLQELDFAERVEPSDLNAILHDFESPPEEKKTSQKRCTRARADRWVEPEVQNGKRGAEEPESLDHDPLDFHFSRFNRDGGERT